MRYEDALHHVYQRYRSRVEAHTRPGESGRETAKPILAIAKHFRLAGLFDRAATRSATISFARRGRTMCVVGSSSIHTAGQIKYRRCILDRRRRCRMYTGSVYARMYMHARRHGLKAFEPSARFMHTANR